MSRLEELLERNNIDANKLKTDKERIAELEEQNEMLTECILEMASIIYA